MSTVKALAEVVRTLMEEIAALSGETFGERKFDRICDRLQDIIAVESAGARLVTNEVGRSADRQRADYSSLEQRVVDQNADVLTQMQKVFKDAEEDLVFKAYGGTDPMTAQKAKLLMDQEDYLMSAEVKIKSAMDFLGPQAKERAEKLAELTALTEEMGGYEKEFEASRPLPPDVMVSALQDQIHPPSGRLLNAMPIFDKASREAVRLEDEERTFQPRSENGWLERLRDVCAVNERAEKAEARVEELEADLDYTSFIQGIQMSDIRALFANRITDEASKLDRTIHGPVERKKMAIAGVREELLDAVVSACDNDQDCGEALARLAIFNEIYPR